MSKNILSRFTLVGAFVAALFLSGCGDDSSEQQRLNIESGKIINEAYEAQDYHRIIALADSLKTQGNLSEGQADYWLGYAYDQLEETTTAKERMESELRIARNIQMSMVPSVFPEIDGLDMYGSMTPAKEVGGDLYNYLLLDDKLYFCIGDVSGKGVPASLFMAIATRGFRTLALAGKTPAEIATRLNYELTENNDEGMFVTMFICRLDLKTLQLEYCNAGHNPPIIGDAANQFTFLDVIPNAPIGLWPGLEFEGEEIKLQDNHRLLLYTDGLNEAENRQQEQYGEDRIVKLLTQHSSSNCHDIIEALKTDTDLFRDGAEQNDDLTMLAIYFKKTQSFLGAKIN